MIQVLVLTFLGFGFSSNILGFRVCFSQVQRVVKTLFSGVPTISSPLEYAGYPDRDSILTDFVDCLPKRGMPIHGRVM